MNLDDILGPPVAFGEFVRNPETLPAWAWLHTREQGEVSSLTVCRATLVDSRELSEDECEAREATFEKEGFRCLLSRGQIEDIIENLRHRFPSPTGDQIVKAVRFYLAHDAFIVS